MTRSKTRRGLTLAALLAMLMLSGCGWPFSSKKTEEPAKAQAVAEKTESPVVPPVVTDLATEVQKGIKAFKLSDHSSVAAVIAYNQFISHNLTTIKENVAARKKQYDTTVVPEKDLIKGLELMLTNADTAREDIDRVIRTAEDIQYELKFAKRQYEANVEFFKARAEETTDSSLRQILESTSQWFQALGDDTPRRQKVVEDFLKEMGTLRTQITEATRVLRDQRTALDLGARSLEPLTLTAKGKEYIRQVDEYLTAVGAFYDAFFGNSAYKDAVKSKSQDTN